MKAFVTTSLILLLAACSVQKTYYDAALSVAAQDEAAGNLKAAEENYSSAVWRAKNHLSDKETSTALYDFGLFYLKHGEYAASVKTLKESIQFATKSNSFNKLAMGRRYITLSASYAELNKWKEGSIYLAKVLPFYQQYTGDELKFVKAISSLYYQQLTKIGEDTTFIPKNSIN